MGSRGKMKGRLARSDHRHRAAPQRTIRGLPLSKQSSEDNLGFAMWSLLKEFLQFARQEKKWWLVPLIVVLVALGAILIFTSSSGLAWALYPFM
jgi:hypothetical protein